MATGRTQTRLTLPQRGARLTTTNRFPEAEVPLAPGSSDLVTLANMIPFFDELARVLAPEGTCLRARRG